MNGTTVTAPELPQDRPRARSSSPTRRTNPYGWQFANQARRTHGHRRALQMLSCQLAGMDASTIARYFRTTRDGVYAQLYRLRNRRYDTPPIPRPKGERLRVAAPYA